jgi:glycosyltransferase involved in cell wall biosynthesis
LVIINDASTDGSGETYINYFKFYKIDKKYYTYIENKRRVTALQNFYLASINHCSVDSVVITLDADD